MHPCRGEASAWAQPMGRLPQNPLHPEPLEGQDPAVFTSEGLMGTGDERMRRGGDRSFHMGPERTQGQARRDWRPGWRSRGTRQWKEVPCSHREHPELLDSFPASPPAHRTCPSLCARGKEGPSVSTIRTTVLRRAYVRRCAHGEGSVVPVTPSPATLIRGVRGGEAKESWMA